MIKKLLYTSLLSSSILFSYAFCSDAESEIEMGSSKKAEMATTSIIPSSSDDTKKETTQEYSDAYILRIGSVPHGGYRGMKDNSYDAFKDGAYESTLKGLGFPLDHLLHIYKFEKEKDPNSSTTNPNYRRLSADFNSPSFIEDVTKFKFAESTAPQREKTYFDMAITDSRTTKFISSREAMTNLLFTLKIGGKLILTDVNEIYPFSDGFGPGLKVPRAIGRELEENGWKIGYSRGFHDDQDTFSDKNFSTLAYVSPYDDEALEIAKENITGNAAKKCHHGRELLRAWAKDIHILNMPEMKVKETYLPMIFEFIDGLNISEYLLVHDGIIKESWLEGEHLEKYNQEKAKVMAMAVDKAIYSRIDEMLDPMLDREKEGRRSYPPSYIRTIEDFNGMKLTVEFYDNVDEYKKSGNIRPVEEYLYELGNPSQQVELQEIKYRGKNAKTLRTSDRIVVVTRNS